MNAVMYALQETTYWLTGWMRRPLLIWDFFDYLAAFIVCYSIYYVTGLILRKLKNILMKYLMKKFHLRRKVR